MTAKLPLSQKKIVIVGGSAGIGRATARSAVEAGATVVIASRDEAHLAEAAEAIGGDVHTCAFDVRDTRAMDYCLEQVAPFDHLVVTAADVQPAPFLEAELDEAKALFDTKFWGAFSAVQAAVPFLRAEGSVVLFSGVAAHRPVRGLATAAAANGAVEAFVRSLAVELAPIRINAVAPGFVDTHGMDPQRRERLEAELPAGRVGEARDLAHAVLFLLTNPYTTGTVLHVDGGHGVV